MPGMERLKFAPSKALGMSPFGHLLPQAKRLTWGEKRTLGFEAVGHRKKHNIPNGVFGQIGVISIQSGGSLLQSEQALHWFPKLRLSNCRRLPGHTQFENAVP